MVVVVLLVLLVVVVVVAVEHGISILSTCCRKSAGWGG